MMSRMGFRSSQGNGGVSWMPTAPAGGLPAVGLDFVGQRGALSGVRVPIASLLTATRASTATYINSAGVLTTAATDELRYTYDPVTLAPLGILGEGARTNLVLNSAALSTQSVTVTAVAHTLSFYGTGSITLSGAAVATVNGTGAFPTRVTSTFTPSAGSLTLTVSGSVTQAQLEIGAFASSYIPTTGATATRAADLIKLSASAVAALTSLSTEYTHLYDFINNPVSGRLGGVANEAAPSINNRISHSLTTTVTLVAVSGAVTQASLASAALNAPPARNKAAFAAKQDLFWVSVNGAAAQTDLSGVMPATTLDRVALLSDPWSLGGTAAYTTLAGFYAWDARLSTTDGESLSA